ncbi:SMI1/KNR4 family protein [Peribacillus sp. NPDC006672]|uniref:SMI1/KNR4 family protein n=1 Tax=Peribacillus sp. NPDC006672 TaxID=3390606 RepID=UPI003D025A75
MKNIWEDYEDDEYQLDKLTVEDITLAEKELNIKIPKEYIDLLKEKNGGYLKYQSLPVNFKNSWADDHVPINVLFGIKKNEGIFESKLLLNEWGIKEENFITISGDGHTWIVMDYRKNKIEPEITFIDIEENKTTVIFKSFKEMINNLYEHIEDDFDVSEFEYEMSTERAKKLMKSNNIEDIVEGIFNWTSSYEDMDELISTLISLLENTSEKAVKMAAAENLVGLITSEYLSDESLINKVKNLVNTPSETEIKVYYEVLVDFLNEQ